MDQGGAWLSTTALTFTNRIAGVIVRVGTSASGCVKAAPVLGSVVPAVRAPKPLLCAVRRTSTTTIGSDGHKSGAVAAVSLKAYPRGWVWTTWKHRREATSRWQWAVGNREGVSNEQDPDGTNREMRGI